MTRIPLTSGMTHGYYPSMPKHPMFSMRVPADVRARWEVAAKQAGLTLPAWVIFQCETTATIHYVGPTLVDNVEIPPASVNEHREILKEVSAAGAKSRSVEKRLKVQKRPPSEKKQKRSAAAKATRESVVIPQHHHTMVEVRATTAKCPHGVGVGDTCLACDPKKGYPLFPD